MIASIHRDCIQSSIDKLLWLNLCKEKFKKELQYIEAMVQSLLEGPICRSNLLWELWETPIVQGHYGDQKRGVVVAKHCFILTNRFDDFIKEMQNGDRGVVCKYVKIKIKLAKEDGLAKATLAPSRDFSQYSFLAHTFYGVIVFTVSLPYWNCSIANSSRFWSLLL